MTHANDSGANDSYFRVRAAAEEAILLAGRSREMAQLTRLRLKLEHLAAAFRAQPATTGRERARRLEEILEAVMAAAEAPMGNIQLVDPTSGALRIHAHRGFGRPFLDFFNAVHEGEAACGTAFEQVAPVVIEDVEGSPIFTDASRKVMRAARAAAVQSVTLTTRSEGRVGVVSVHYHDCGVAELRQKRLAALAPPVAELVALGVRG